MYISNIPSIIFLFINKRHLHCVPPKALDHLPKKGPLLMQACSFLFIYRKTRIFKRREPKSKGRVHSKYIGGIKEMSKQQIEPHQT